MDREIKRGPDGGYYYITDGGHKRYIPKERALKILRGEPVRTRKVTKKRKRSPSPQKRPSPREVEIKPRRRSPPPPTGLKLPFIPEIEVEMMEVCLVEIARQKEGDKYTLRERKEPVCINISKAAKYHEVLRELVRNHALLKSPKLLGIFRRPQKNLILLDKKDEKFTDKMKRNSDSYVIYSLYEDRPKVLSNLRKHFIIAYGTAYTAITFRLKKWDKIYSSVKEYLGEKHEIVKRLDAIWFLLRLEKTPSYFGSVKDKVDKHASEIVAILNRDFPDIDFRAHEYIRI